ncbi:MFS transporter [Caldimonas brevitalea]|uniref:MFS transporter n=1 Tax=Caldimonas brevitalea TaxID=413882 RepID=A0A0G3BBL1_9BURK|nr:MFS transporter [Caldimonas brevitalea]AKJ26697.1 MFS transporter [Caldimonas brevitalea]
MNQPIAAATGTVAATRSPPDASPWPVFGIAAVAVLLVSVDSTVLFAAFSALRRAFHGTDASDLSWVINAYTVVYAALLVPAGRLADRHGRRRMFRLGLALFLVASLACGAAGSVPLLVAARVLQAMGAALLTPASLALVLAAFGPQRRAVAVSLWGAVGGLAAALGPSLGSFVVDTLGWSWAFYLNLLPGGWALWRSGRLAESRDPDRGAPADLPGIVMLIVAVGAPAYGVVQSESHGWSHTSVLLPLACGAVALALFIAWARGRPHPAVDLSLFQHRTYRYVNLATFTFGMAFALMFFGFFFFMTHVWHYSLPLAGLAVTPGPLLVVPVAMLGGRLAARHGHRPLLVGGSLLYAAGGTWFYLRAGATPDYLYTWLPGLLMTGTAVGLVLPSLSGAAVARLPPARFGVGSAVNQAVRQMGSVLGVALTVVLVGHGAPSLADFEPLYAAHVLLALTTALLCLPVDTRPQVATLPSPPRAPQEV